MGDLPPVLGIRIPWRNGARFAAGLFNGLATGLRLASFQVPAQRLGKPLLTLVTLRAVSVCGIIAHRGVA